MVHALQETHRALKRGGALIDLRPAAKNRAIELELDGTRLHIGEMDSSRAFDDYAAADDALLTMMERGLFAREHEAEFIATTDIDSVEDLRAFAESLRRSVMPADIPRRIESLIDVDSEDVIIRARRTMGIRRYRRR